MADDDFAPVEPPPDVAAEGVDELRRQRAERAANPPPPPEPEPEGPPVRKLSYDEKAEPVSAREAGKLLQSLREAEAQRAERYGLDAAPNDTGRAGRAAEVNPPEGSNESEALAAERQQLEAERQYYEAERQAQQHIAGLSSTEQQLAATEAHVAQTVQAGLAEFNRLYADLTSVEAVQRLQQEDPQRFQAYQNYWTALVNADQQLQQVQQQRGAVAQQRQAVGMQEFQRAAAAHDDHFIRSHPELQDSARLREVQTAAQRYLRERGLSEQELADHWSGKRSFSLRESFTQSVLYDAVKYRMAMEQLQSRGRAKEVPPVLRPGQRADRGEDMLDKVERATRQLERNSSGQAGLAAAVGLLQARRAMRR